MGGEPIPTLGREAGHAAGGVPGAGMKFLRAQWTMAPLEVQRWYVNVSRVIIGQQAML